MDFDIDQNKIIGSLAHKYWEWAGKPHGCDLDFWSKAEKKVLQIQEAMVNLYQLIAECERRNLSLPTPHKYGAKHAALLSVARMIDCEIGI